MTVFRARNERGLKLLNQHLYTIIQYMLNMFVNSINLEKPKHYKGDANNNFRIFFPRIFLNPRERAARRLRCRFFPTPPLSVLRRGEHYTGKIN
jgi:hypothetical protein